MVIKPRVDGKQTVHGHVCSYDDIKLSGYSVFAHFCGLQSITAMRYGVIFKLFVMG